MSLSRADTRYLPSRPGVGRRGPRSAIAVLALLAVASAGRAAPSPERIPPTRPLDFDYRLEGATGMVLQVFDDGEAVHVQPAGGVQLRSPAGGLRQRGPYLIVPGRPARFALVDAADAARRVDIVHRRRALDEPALAGGGDPRTLVPAPAATPLGGEGTAQGERLWPRVGGRDEEADTERTTPTASAGTRASAPSAQDIAPETLAIDTVAGGARPGPPLDAAAGAQADRVAAAAGTAGRPSPLVASAPSDTRDIPSAGTRDSRPLVFPAQSTVQSVLRRWLSAQGIVVEFVGVPLLRVEEEARVQAGDLHDAVREALDRLGLRGEWLPDRLRVHPAGAAP